MPMAFLSTLLTGPEASYPLSLREHLSTFALFDGLGDAAVRKLLSESCWFGLPGGVTLRRDGENQGALFLVVTGAVAVFVEDEQLGRRMVAQVPAGETVGEMSLLGDETTARIVALRDTELLRIGHDGFEALVARHPRLALNMMRIMVKRLRDTARNARQRAKPKTFGIIPLQDGLTQEPIAQRLAQALVEAGCRAGVLDSSVCDRTAEWFDTFETAHDVVFYRGDAPGTPWTSLCERQADRVLYLARADRPLPPRPVHSLKERVAGLPDLLLLHPGSSGSRMPPYFAVHSGSFETHHHIRDGRTDDVQRLARYVSGRAVGFVLGGGGARGFAHIGVAKALMEAKVPLDFLGGVSMGAIIAAGLAAEWGIEEMCERMRDVFVVRRPLSDYTVPLIALVRGKKVSGLLKTHFGDMRIEELAKPYFCVSSDLTTGRVHEHRTGLIWRTLRASVALPGILPPVSHRGHLLVDGGVMNNLPVDVMRARRIGPLIASDVTGEVDMSVRDSRYGERPVWRLLWQRMRGTPSIVSILMRAGTVGSEAQRVLVREQADYLFEPAMPNVGVRDWRLFDRAVEEGYVHACRQIEKHGVPLTALWSDGDAVSVPESNVPAAP